MGFGMDYGHLISISLDKISSETEGCGGGNGRKNHEMDLRKALLVAHFIESIQNYSNDHHNQYVNELRYNEANSKQQHDEALKELQPTAHDEPHRTSTRDDGEGVDESAAPSATVLQCVINNSDSQTSRYCQYTMPVVCSVNTQQVMSSTPYSQVSSTPHQPQHPEEVIEAPEVVIGGDDLDVSACCEIESTPLSDTEDDSVDDDVIVRTSSPLKRSSPSPMGPPLPKKKRPLPKEVLESCMMKDDTDDDEDCFPGCFDVSMEEDDDDADDEEEDYASKLRRSSLEDYVVTPPSTMTLQSITSTSVSTSSRPKVLVQVTDSARYHHQQNSWNRMYLHQPQSQQPKHHPQPSGMAAAAATTGLLF